MTDQSTSAARIASAPTALQTSAKIARGEVSVLEVVTEALDRAHRDQLGAFTHLADEQALAQARELDIRLARGEKPGPLFGVPCPVKDLAQVAGWPFEAGSAVLRGNVAGEDSGVVTRMREAGMVLIGKTATPEFGLPCYTEPEGRPAAVTPFDPGRGAGGSSGGAAAAVSGGSVSIAHGSDGGGSIRIPAASCGLVGLKASRGRISPGPLAVDGPGLVSEGMLTLDVADTAAALDLLSVGWPGDWSPGPVEESFLARLDQPLPRLRVGVLTEPVIAETRVHPQALEAVRRTAERLGEMGHEIAEAERPFPVETWDAFRALWSVGALTIPVPPEAEDQLRPLTRWLREQGRSFTQVEYAAALASAQRATRQAALAWHGLDVVLSPTLAQPPAPVGSLRHDDDPARDFAEQTAFTPWTSVWNLIGRPALTLPLHTAVVDGVELPFGVMLGGPMYSESVLLSLGHQLMGSRS